MSFTKKILIFCIGCVTLLSAGFVLALEVQYPDILGHSLNDTSDLAAYVCYFFGLLMNLAIFIAVIVIAWGGVQYIFTLGIGKMIDPKKGTRAPDEAKSWVKAGITGLLIAVLATLIAYTINPELTKCKFGFLEAIPFTYSGSSTLPAGVDVKTYKEIPIGVLTENLLTRTMDCYGFDQSGNPVDGEKLPTGDKGPTYLDHDRADCLTQLIEGAQEKSQVIAALSNELHELMNSCDCAAYGKCNNTCGGLAGCDQPTYCPVQATCTGNCIKSPCQQAPGTNDCCPAGVKDKIEHGPVDVAVDVGDSSGVSGVCEADVVKFKGLDEFRCPVPGLKFQQCAGFPALVEKQVRANGKVFTLIDHTKWTQLNLWQQLTYFKEKIANWKIDSKIQEDEKVLDKARVELNKCYLAIPYVDLLKNYEGARQKERLILTQKVFTDPVTNKKIDASKYCDGFNYDNSSCFKKCNDACPDATPDAIQKYKACGKCDQADEACLTKQETCIEKAFNDRPCPNASWENPPKDFKTCMSSCQNECTKDCGEKYLECSNEYALCESRCQNNGQCVLDKAGKCLFGAKDFQQCANQNTDQGTDQGNADYCISRAYLCKNGSDQYAGYQDCVDTTAISTCSIDEYSASFVYNHPECQKCFNPYGPAAENGACYSEKNPNSPCQEMCPETSKCPTSSKCPDCPCEQIEQTLNFSVPSTFIGKYNAYNEEVSAYQIVGPQCNSISHNDDPLTFYCEDNWWQSTSISKQTLSPKPIGTDRVCPASGEVQIGKTVDDAKKWVKELIRDAEKIIKNDIQPILDEMTVIGKAKDTSPIQDYCKCNALLENAKPICKTDCEYARWWGRAEFDDDGNMIRPAGWRCACLFVPCKGKPCQQIMDYLVVLWNYYGKFKSDFIDFYITMLQEPRSDIMKELTYSRQKTSSCSVENVAHGKEVKLLSCTRVEDELIAPVNTSQINFNGETIDAYCYGTDLGLVLKKPADLTDNWFCCELWNKNPTTK